MARRAEFALGEALVTMLGRAGDDLFLTAVSWGLRTRLLAAAFACSAAALALVDFVPLPAPMVRTGVPIVYIGRCLLAMRRFRASLAGVTRFET